MPVVTLVHLPRGDWGLCGPGVLKVSSDGVWGVMMACSAAHLCTAGCLAVSLTSAHSGRLGIVYVLAKSPGAPCPPPKEAAGGLLRASERVRLGLSCGHSHAAGELASNADVTPIYRDEFQAPLCPPHRSHFHRMGTLGSSSASPMNLRIWEEDSMPCRALGSS